MNGWGGRKTNPESALQADKVETSKNYQGKVKSPALQNLGQGTQIRPWATTVPPALLIVYRLVPVATARPKVHFHSIFVFA